MTIVSSLHRLVSPHCLLGGLIVLGGLSGCQQMRDRCFGRSASSSVPAQAPFGSDLGMPDYQNSDSFSTGRDGASPLEFPPEPLQPVPGPPAPSGREYPPMPPTEETGPKLQSPGARRPSPATEPLDTERKRLPGLGPQTLRLKAAREKFAAVIAGSKSTSPQRKTPPPTRTASGPGESSQPPAKARSRISDKVALFDRFRFSREPLARPVSQRQLSESHKLSESQPVRMAPPPEIYQYPDGQERSLASMLRADGVENIPRGGRNELGYPGAQEMPLTAAQPVPATVASGRPVFTEDPDQLPLWPLAPMRNQQSAAAPFVAPAMPRNPAGRPLDLTPGSEPAYAPAPIPSSLQVPAESAANFPMHRVSQRTALPAATSLQNSSTSSGTRQEARRDQQMRDTGAGLSIPRVAICREVRGYENISEFNTGSLNAGQQILIYATLANYHSLPTSEGYRTMTLSSLEVRSRTGRLISRQPLGTAVDLSRTQRQEYFLTHAVTIPEALPAGDYIFQLSVYDLISQQSSQSQVGVQITEGHSPRGERDDTARSAIHPANSLR